MIYGTNARGTTLHGSKNISRALMLFLERPSPRSSAKSFGGRALFRRSAAIVLLILIGLGAGTTQNAGPSTLDSSDIIQFLTKTISWYRQTSAEQQIVTEPADLTFFEDNRRVATQIVRLAFDFARQQAEAKAKETAQTQAQGGNGSQYQSMIQLAQAADKEVESTQAEIPPLQKQLETGAGKNRAKLQTLIAETQSEVSLLEARRDVLHSMVDFVSGTSANGLGASGLRAQVEELARSVPPALSKASGGNQTDQTDSQQDSAKLAPIANKEPPSGVWGLSADLFNLSHKRRVLRQEALATDALIETSKQLRAPLVAKLKTMIQSGDELAKEADSSDQAVLAQEKQKLDKLTLDFRQTAAAILPLSKQGIVLDLYKRSLTSWDDSVRSEFKSELRNLLARLAVLVIVILVVLGLGEIWRRTIFRYVHDVRRRSQFLLLRRIVLWVAIALVVAFTFATQLGSVVTFAGLITAGVAVALQNVIISMVGYFFLIGKFGIRVGDRVQVSGVTGEVVDIGLVRFHLMEVGSGGTDSQPTGRVVAFSNSIVFQPAAGLFKQIPGTNFVWHEIDLTFAAESDYKVVRERVNAAVQAAFADYHEKMELQRRQMEMTLDSVATVELKPKIHLHFSSVGIEVNIRFPVEMTGASEIDERIMRELLTAIAREPRLKLVGSEMPTVKAAS
jgi:small-conductance mechanosensitive channel